MDECGLTDICPPHHWLIEDQENGSQAQRRWVCVHCSDVRDEALPRVTAPRRKYQSSSSWSREEYLLAGMSPDGQTERIRSVD